MCDRNVRIRFAGAENIVNVGIDAWYYYVNVLFRLRIAQIEVQTRTCQLNVIYYSRLHASVLLDIDVN